MSSRVRRLGPLLASGAVLLALVGCGSDADPEDSGTESSTAQSPSADAADTSEAAEPSAEEGAEEGRVSGGGVSFALPPGWTSVEAADVKAQAEDNSAFAEAAEEMGMSAEELGAAVGQAELLLLDPDSAATGFTSNINVTLPGGALPSESEIEQQFTQIGATVTGLSTEEAGVGEVVNVVYDMSISGGEIHGEALAAEVNGELVIVTVSAAKRAETTKLADGILSSLEEE